MNIACANKGEEERSRFSMGAALEATKYEKMISHLIAFVDIDIHLSQNYIFNTSVLLNKKLWHMSNPFFPLRRAFLLLLC